MTIERMEHVGIVVDDLAAATAFFVELGLKLQGELRVSWPHVEESEAPASCVGRSPAADDARLAGFARGFAHAGLVCGGRDD